MSRARKPQTKAREWETMRPAHAIPDPAYAHLAQALAGPNGTGPEIWMNDRYIASVERRPDGSVGSISYRRTDRKPARDWRDTMRIKNDIAGDEVEAVELYPAMSRLMDTSNQYWLWCAEPGVQFPIGFEKGAVSGPDAIPEGARAVQRELPDDWQDPDLVPLLSPEVLTSPADGE